MAGKPTEREPAMQSLGTRKSDRFAAVVVTLTAACMLAQFDAADAQQYYYQPPPDYYQNDTAAGTVVGGAFGAVTGAIVGGRKHGGQDALIGAGVGALTGNLLGRSKDRVDERQAAAGAAAVSQINQQAAAMAVTNYDLLNMTRAGVSEDLIISTMRVARHATRPQPAGTHCSEAERGERPRGARRPADGRRPRLRSDARGGAVRH